MYVASKYSSVVSAFIHRCQDLLTIQLFTARDFSTFTVAQLHTSPTGDLSPSDPLFLRSCFRGHRGSQTWCTQINQIHRLRTNGEIRRPSSHHRRPPARASRSFFGCTDEISECTQNKSRIRHLLSLDCKCIANAMEWDGRDDGMSLQKKIYIHYPTNYYLYPAIILMLKPVSEVFPTVSCRKVNPDSSPVRQSYLHQNYLHSAIPNVKRRRLFLSLA